MAHVVNGKYQSFLLNGFLEKSKLPSCFLDFFLQNITSKVF